MFPIPGLSLGTKVFGVLSIVLLLGGVGGGLYFTAQVSKLETTVQEVKNERDRANDDRDKAVRANEVNVATIAALRADKTASDKIIGKLEADKKILNQHFDNIMTKVVLNPKLEDGPVAPVLRETVRSIQEKGKTK